ncbi:phosphoserine phosphatase [Halorubrum saccharovorum DSM 1137]|uniref:phosphoserine phosphatase n=1 Tax=Halorubrum saccharovorum DSM 1137 TaxID=1227484 RepID=M0DQY5_9EURY|nr:HAD-IB family phosphatase [Halorubrum saccharovorum]ELZ36539.1 phosphoserine phosphatase [Halorubrum saccharovorum DSM 1137]
MLVAFDFDGALAVSDPFVRLGEQHGTGNDIASLLDRMRAGDIEHEGGLRSIADHLEGLETEEVEEAFTHLQRRSGASDLLGALQRAGHHVAVISDAPEVAIRSCLEADTFDVDTVVGTRLVGEKGALTGEIEGSLLGESKDAVLKEIVAREGAEMAETVAVGDDRRDLPMIQAAATGIGVDPDTAVADQCDHVVPTIDRLQLRFEEHGIV